MTLDGSAVSLWVYPGISFGGSMTVTDANGSTVFEKELNYGTCFSWTANNVQLAAGTQLTVMVENAQLFELAFRDANGRLVPVTGGGALFDEQTAVPDTISQLNSMYFDEIYHGRTGYEQLHKMPVYETTHPPLGKDLIMVGIALFGMTAFGWRFAGALIGVLMLPALYLLALQLTHRRSIATVSMVAFSLDLMHYTQTRIATIDSFPVFFILLSYLCMVRYLQTDLFAADGEKPRLFDRCLRRSLIPLALSGLFMGLAIASKWIGLYAAVGLALLFFVAIYRQYRVSNVACGLDVEHAKLDDSQKARVRAAQDFTLKRILITCGFCVIFFVLVPCVIYYLCYIPYLSPTGPVTLKRVIDAQIGMLNYHSTPGLGMDHPFQSPWWQWPFILKPMWFAQDSYEPAGYASTIMCMGNPWVFYLGAIAMLGALTACGLKYLNLRSGVSLRQGDGDLTLPVLAVGFLAQYLPWVLVPRSMYIYHYFASVPFIILATAWWLDRLPRSRPRLRMGVMALYLVGALAFFVMFFPYASGWLTSTGWLDAMKWFSKLYY